MGKVITQIINNFSYGMTNDPREPDTRYAQLIRNFDAHSYKHKLVPFKNMVDGDSAGNTSKKKNFAIALRTGTTYSLYALGVMLGNSRAEILYKDLTLTGTDLSDSTWTDTTDHQSTYNTDFNLFVFYKKTGRIYGAQANAGTSYIWAYDPAGTVAFADTHLTLATAYVNMAGGLVHSKDDILYIGYDNIIVKNNNGSWTDPALTLPTSMRITSLAEYGNYLAIGCQPVSGLGQSIVYLWDRDSSVGTLAESINWGEGNLFVLEEIDGYLVGISNVGSPGSTLGTNFNQRIVFRAYAGGKPQVFREFISQETATSLSVQLRKQKVNNYLYFLLAMTFPDGTLHEGLWKVGRNKDGVFSVTFDRGPNNDTGAGGTMYGFIVVGDFVFFGYDTAGGVHDVTKTEHIAAGTNYTAISAYETVILNDGDSSITKKLLGITVFTEPLPVAGQVVLKYKINAETSFTTIFTNTTDDSLSHSAVNIESSGASLPEYKELTLRIESTGGAVITGLKYKAEVIQSDIYD